MILSSTIIIPFSLQTPAQILVYRSNNEAPAAKASLYLTLCYPGTANKQKLKTTFHLGTISIWRLRPNLRNLYACFGANANLDA